MKDITLRTHSFPFFSLNSRRRFVADESESDVAEELSDTASGSDDGDDKSDHRKNKRPAKEAKK